MKYIEGLLERASNLLAKKNRDKNIVDDDDDDDDDDNGPSSKVASNNVIDNQRMQEYQELVTAFYTEQKLHSDLDGEELVPREDIVWLLHELKWRYEEILTNYELRQEEQESNNSLDECNEWAELVKELVSVLKKVVKLSRREQPSYNSHQQTEANQSNVEIMEKMKRDYRDQIANMSQLVSDLESKLIDQEDEQQKLQMTIEEERQSYALSTEGTIARIRYLEGMVRSLEMESKNSRARTHDRDNNSVPTNHGTATPSSPPSRPVFMRDLTVEDIMQDDNTMQEDASNVDSDEITTLRNEITCLGNDLAESENARATLLDEYQKERLNYMMQFKKMSEVLKQFTEGTECNITSNNLSYNSSNKLFSLSEPRTCIVTRHYLFYGEILSMLLRLSNRHYAIIGSLVY
jgi:hypothetical protein